MFKKSFIFIALCLSLLSSHMSYAMEATQTVSLEEAIKNSRELEQFLQDTDVQKVVISMIKEEEGRYNVPLSDAQDAAIIIVSSFYGVSESYMGLMGLYNRYTSSSFMDVSDIIDPIFYCYSSDKSKI